MVIKLCLLVCLAITVNGALLGSNRCTWGPSYWCTSFGTADECGAIDHCREKVWIADGSSVAKTQAKDSDACTYCKDMITDLKNFLEKNQTRSVILHYWNRACDFMPDQFSQQECSKIEQHYLDLFLEMVKKDLDAQTICTVAMLCGKARPSAVSQPLKPTKVMSVPLTKVSLASTDDTQTCAACQAFMTILSDNLKDQANQKKIEALLMKECQQVGGDYAQECQTVVTQYLPEAFALLEQELNKNACQLLKFCPASSVTALKAITQARLNKWLVTSSLSTQLQGVALRLGDETCDVCEEGLGFAKIFLSNNGTEQEVAQTLENDICSKLGQYASMCNTAVQDYLPIVWSKLLGYLDPAGICTKLGLCTSSARRLPSPKPVAPVKPRARASVQCVICEFVMNKLESMVSTNATEAEIISAVEKVCSILPQSVRSECDSLVEKYGPAIINLLVHDASPSVVCGFLGLCAAGDNMYKAPLRGVKEDNCMMCELAMSYMQSMLQKNSTQAEIEQLLEKVCNYLSGSVAQECNSMIEKYAPQILKMLVSDIKPKDICTKLGLCKSMKADGLVHLYRISDNS